VNDACELEFYRKEARRLSRRVGELKSTFSYRLSAPVRLIERLVTSLGKRSLADNIRKFVGRLPEQQGLPGAPLSKFPSTGRRAGEARQSCPLHPVADHSADELGGASLRTFRTKDHVTLLYISGEPNTPGHLYRVIRFISAAEANGIRADWIPQEELAERLSRIGVYDVLVIWRARWDDAIAAAVAQTRAQGGQIVFDVDDLMIDPNLAQAEIIDGIRTQDLKESAVRDHYSQVRQTMLAADLCVTTTQELAYHMRRAGKTTYVLPNGFDDDTRRISRAAMRHWRRNRDGLVRMGYAGGSRTHQRDLGSAIEGIAKVLKERRECRLVLFRTLDGSAPLIDIEEYPCLDGLHGQIEWRPLQPLADLPHEMARFDINLAPLECGNPFCEAKSELKFFEAALVGVPTVASPTGPFGRAIEQGKTGFLAAAADDWYFYLKKLIDDPGLRRTIARDAYHAALAKFGPRQRALQFGRFIEQLQGGARAARGFALDVHLAARPYAPPRVFASDTVFESDQGGGAEVSVVIPLYNYENYIVEALESVCNQSLETLDLIIVDDHSTDRSLEIATAWARNAASRFNRIAVLANPSNIGLGPCRNSAFDAADTPYVLPLDADNRLTPNCCEALLRAVKRSSAAYIYPTIQQFGAATARISNAPYEPQRFVGENYIDAMALVSKEAWAMIGGYDSFYGWEDYDFWCRLAEIGLVGEWLAEPLAEYRVHPQSMLRTQTTVPAIRRRLYAKFASHHPWISLTEAPTAELVPKAAPSLSECNGGSRLDALLAILRCPVTKQKLAYDESRSSLVSLDGMQKWPIKAGRAVLAPTLPNPEIRPIDHFSNDLPDRALEIIRAAGGLVLNLSAGGSREKFDHVVEVEFAIFRHTDVAADAHNLPFDDDTFEAVIVMNAFEHYREPQVVADEIRRVLKPGGRVHVHTAFLQPLHEHPQHFYNCTRYGLAEWFRDFETAKLHVSDNFCPNYSISWLASELEAALRRDVSGEAADAFRACTVATFVDLWREPGIRNIPIWTNFQKLSQESQEITAAGFEFIGRKAWH
jgi:GT2 family glycosyltransferase/glycosyltransferase involved in cell wall biosynthesis/SAM-dependent methyltransferase